MDKKVLHQINCGLYLIGARLGDKINGQIANTVFQVASNPPKIAVSLHKENLTHKYVVESKMLSISILSEETPMKFIGTFGFKSGKDIDKFTEIKYKLGIENLPIVMENAIGYIESRVTDIVDVGSHSLFICEVLNSELLDSCNPMTYAYYHLVKGGKSPKNAPTY